jgi:hypothetical protein
MLTMVPTPRIILYFFVMVLLLPTVDLFFKIDPFTANDEKRELAKFRGVPKSITDLQKFPREFNAYINDNFGFRNTLLIGNYLNKYRLLRTSPSDQVLLGQGGWLYYAGDGEANDSRHVSKLTDAQLHRMAMSYELKRQWLASRGIQYILVIAPNKSTSYSEYLPSSFNIVRPESVVDDLKKYLGNNSAVVMLDPRDDIKKNKKSATLYYKYDSHWNNNGAFIVYSQIMQQINTWFPDVTILSLDDFIITKKLRKAGDFAQMVGGGKFISDEEYVLTPKKSYSATVTEKNLKSRDPLTMVNKKADYNIVVFRDSFFSALVPFVSESFKLSRYYWQSWDSHVDIDKVVNKYKPNIVVEEVAERFIKYELNDIVKHPPKWAFDLLKNKFIASSYPVLKLSPASFTASDQVTANKLTSGVKIVSTGNDPKLIFTKLKLNYSAGKTRVVRVVITSSVETDLQLFIKNKPDADFIEGKSIKAHLNKGENDILLPMLFPGDIDALRLDPSTIPGQFAVQSIEIRYIDNLHMIVASN